MLTGEIEGSALNTKSVGAQRRTLYFTSQHRTTMWSDHKLVRTEAGLRADSKSKLSGKPSIPPVNTVYQMVVRTRVISLCEKRRGLELSEESCVPPVDTVPQCGQIVNL